ncbi:hypothetical protein QR680_012913 [Steinernema hermaphroditum]|uniref:HTH cro/C1-type domain-containing protein n=1 Tax=Steinernema hermaphroditum TaxID=289476 RepID=A0AA39I3Q9_9BILA|nr:hypothetical protein QR680_012913 [Steinernema hermaphroditum]
MHLARQANEWTQKDLATRVNEKPPVVTEYENEADNVRNRKQDEGRATGSRGRWKTEEEKDIIFLLYF